MRQRVGKAFGFCASIALPYSTETLSAQARPQVAGTYRLVVCNSAPCTPADSAAATVWGTVVLGDSVFRSAGLTPEAALQLRSRHNVPNACLVLSRRERGVSTYAGYERVSTSTWNVTPAGIEMDLYRSPDAGHRMTAAVRGDTLFGTGESWGLSAQAGFQWERDTIVAVRTGPPDYGICVRAALAPQPERRSVAAAPHTLDGVPDNPDTTRNYLIFLRGNTTQASSLWDSGSVVIIVPYAATQRTAALDTTTAMVTKLLGSGVAARRITVVGIEASVETAILVSARITQPVGYVLVGGCARAGNAATGAGLHGEVLSILRKGARPAESCNAVFDASPQILVRAEQVLSADVPDLMYLSQGEWPDWVSDWARYRRAAPRR